MKVVDWVGVGLLGVVVVGGGIFFVARARPAQGYTPATQGAGLPVTGTSQGYMPTQPGQDTTGRDVVTVVTGLAGLATSIFNSGIFD